MSPNTPFSGHFLLALEQLLAPGAPLVLPVLALLGPQLPGALFLGAPQSSSLRSPQVLRPLSHSTAPRAALSFPSASDLHRLQEIPNPGAA